MNCAKKNSWAYSQDFFPFLLIYKVGPFQSFPLRHPSFECISTWMGKKWKKCSNRIFMKNWMNKQDEIQHQSQTKDRLRIMDRANKRDVKGKHFSWKNTPRPKMNIIVPWKNSQTETKLNKCQLISSKNSFRSGKMSNIRNSMVVKKMTFCCFSCHFGVQAAPKRSCEKNHLIWDTLRTNQVYFIS